MLVNNVNYIYIEIYVLQVCFVKYNLQNRHKGTAFFLYMQEKCVFFFVFY